MKSIVLTTNPSHSHSNCLFYAACLTIAVPVSSLLPGVTSFFWSGEAVAYLQPSLERGGDDSTAERDFGEAISRQQIGDSLAALAIALWLSSRIFPLGIKGAE